MSRQHGGEQQSKITNKAIRTIILIFLLILSLVPFFFITHVQLLEDAGFHPLNQHLENQQQLQLQQQSKSKSSAPYIQPVSCTKYQNDPTIYNSNKDMSPNETKRLTITTPPFYISLHNQWFDKKRWVHIYKTGDYYEKGLTQLFHDILVKYDVEHVELFPPLMLDIGMNIGWFSLYSKAHGHDVAAFEPNPTMFLRVCESLEFNNWKEDKGFTLWNYGLGTTPGTFNLTLGNNPGGSSFFSERLAPKYRHSMPVQVVTLDSVALQEGWIERKISLIKVDVEGFENYVFEGGKTLLYKGDVDNIIMENSSNNASQVLPMVDMLYDAGYRIMQILSVNGDPYHEDWWETFNPALEARHTAKAESKEMPDSDQINFLSRSTSNIWWQHVRMQQLSSKS